jgi:hypothetical protein
MSYEPPFDDETMRRLGPRYWKDETSGKLAAAVTHYLTGEALQQTEVLLIRAYLWQWIDAPIWNFNPHGAGSDLDSLRAGINSIASASHISHWLARALDAGIDPL